MSSGDTKDPAEQRREKLQALRERRVQVGRRAPAEGAPPAAAPAGGAPGRGGMLRGGAARGGGGGAPGQGADAGRRAQLVQMLKSNPEKRKELMERFPKLREAMQKRGGGAGGAGGGAAGAGAGRPGAGAMRARMRGGGGPGAARPAAPAAAPAANEALTEQVKRLEARLSEMDETLRKTRAELEHARSTDSAAPDAAQRGSAARAKLASLKKAAPNPKKK